MVTRMTATGRPTDSYEQLLAAMLSDLDAAAPQYRPTHYWRVCSRRLLDELAAHGLERFRSRPWALTHFVPTYLFGDLGPDPEALERLGAALHAVLPDRRKTHLELDELLRGRLRLEADYRVHLAAARSGPPFLDAFSESRVGDPVGQLEIEGRRFSRSSLNYLLGLRFARQHVGELPCRTVLEIGGGFGSLGEILASDPRNESLYVDVDIPPTALYSTWYLRQVLGRERVTDALQVRGCDPLELESLRRPGGAAAVLCPWQLPALQGEVDLFVNFISFQEMEPEVVEHYLAQVDRLAARHVLLRNLREGARVAADEGLGVRRPTVGADYDRFLPRYELVATNVLPFGFATVDGFHSELRLYRRR